MSEENEAGSAPAGWYPAGGPDGSLRWWDGARWTEHVAVPDVTAGRSTGRLVTVGRVLVLVVFAFVTLITIGVAWASSDTITSCRRFRGSPSFDELDCRAESAYDMYVFTFWVFLGLWTVTALGALLVIRSWRRERRTSRASL